MEKFWELFEESVVIQAIMAVVLLMTIVYLVCMGLAVPDIIKDPFYLIVGFYFGAKIEKAAVKIAARMAPPGQSEE